MNSFKTTLLWDLLVCDLQHKEAGQSMNHLHLTESREGKESERKPRGGSWKSFGGSRKGAYWKSCTSNWYNIFLFSLLWNCVGCLNIFYGPASYHNFWWTFKNKKSLLFFVIFCQKISSNCHNLFLNTQFSSVSQNPIVHLLLKIQIADLLLEIQISHLLLKIQIAHLLLKTQIVHLLQRFSHIHSFRCSFVTWQFVNILAKCVWYMNIIL